MASLPFGSTAHRIFSMASDPFFWVSGFGVFGIFGAGLFRLWCDLVVA